MKPEQDLEAFAIMTRFLWNNQNVFRHREQSQTILQILEVLRHYLDEFHSTLIPPSPTQTQTLRPW